MKAYQIFQNLSPELGQEIFAYLKADQKDVYQSTLASLAAQRKLRPVFIQRKKPADQYAFLYKTSKLKSADTLVEHLLQIWLMHAHKDLLTAFLDGIGVEHDGEGAVEDLPETIDPKKLQAVATGLLESHPPEVVKVYLHVFNQQQPGGWPELNALFAENAAFRLSEEEAAAGSEEKEVSSAQAAPAKEEEAESKKGEADTEAEAEAEPEESTEESVESEEEEETAQEEAASETAPAKKASSAAKKAAPAKKAAKKKST